MDDEVSSEAKPSKPSGHSRHGATDVLCEMPEQRTAKIEQRGSGLFWYCQTCGATLKSIMKTTTFMAEQLTFGSLFAGFGRMDLGFERAGMRCVWQVRSTITPRVQRNTGQMYTGKGTSVSAENTISNRSTSSAAEIHAKGTVLPESSGTESTMILDLNSYGVLKRFVRVVVREHP